MNNLFTEIVELIKKHELGELVQAELETLKNGLAEIKANVEATLESFLEPTPAPVEPVVDPTPAPVAPVEPTPAPVVEPTPTPEQPAAPVEPTTEPTAPADQPAGNDQEPKA